MKPNNQKLHQQEKQEAMMPTSRGHKQAKTKSCPIKRSSLSNSRRQKSLKTVSPKRQWLVQQLARHTMKPYQGPQIMGDILWILSFCSYQQNIVHHSKYNIYALTQHIIRMG